MRESHRTLPAGCTRIYYQDAKSQHILSPHSCYREACVSPPCCPTRQPSTSTISALLISAVTLIVRTTATHAERCHCQRTSISVHSRYTRPVADLPWHGVSVKLELHTRRFRCQNSLCTRRIFCVAARSEDEKPQEAYQSGAAMGVRFQPFISPDQSPREMSQCSAYAILARRAFGWAASHGIESKERLTGLRRAGIH
jgi:hypothetical protein